MNDQPTATPIEPGEAAEAPVTEPTPDTASPETESPSPSLRLFLFNGDDTDVVCTGDSCTIRVKED